MPPKTRPVYIIKIFGHIGIFGKSGGATWSRKVPIIEAGRKLYCLPSSIDRNLLIQTN